MTSTDPPTLSLLDYARPVLARWWIIVLLVAVATAGTYAYYDRQPKVFEASTRLFSTLDTASPGVVDAGTSVALQQDLLNAPALLTSRSTAAAIVPRLRFRDTPEGLVGSLSATTDSDSTFIRITATRGSAGEAAELVNAVARYYIASRSTGTRRRLTRFLEQQRAQLNAIPRTKGTLTERRALAAEVRQTRLRLASPAAITTQLDPAVPPGAPIAPKPRRNAIFAFVLALFAGIGLTFVLERFDRRFKRVEDVEGVFGLQRLSVLPHAKNPAMFSADDVPKVAPEFVEAFRELRTSLQLGALERPLRRILVTSASPGEGKSTVARNLAMSFREFGRTVVVVDADLRRPAQSRLFGVDGERGLTTVLTGEVTLDDALVHVPVELLGMETLAQIEATAPAGTPDVDSTAAEAAPVVDDPSPATGVGLLPSGGLAANPPAVLAAESTEALFRRLEAQVDVVIIDSPPVLAVSDALALAAGADAVVLVCRMGLSTRDAAVRATDALDRVRGVHVAGVVVNDLAGPDRARYGYGYADGRQKRGGRA